MDYGLTRAGFVASARTERTVHWVYAPAFVVLLVTGSALYLPSLAELIGRRPLLKTIHVYTRSRGSRVGRSRRCRRPPELAGDHP